MRVIVRGWRHRRSNYSMRWRHQGIDALVLEQSACCQIGRRHPDFAANAAIVSARNWGLAARMRAVGVKPQSYDYPICEPQYALPGAAPVTKRRALRARRCTTHRADLVESCSMPCRRSEAASARDVWSVARQGQASKSAADGGNPARRRAGRLRRYPFVVRS